MPLTDEWISKAEDDFRAIEPLRALSPPLNDLAGFHAQQCVEKYLEARLQESLIPFSKTHDLEQWLDSALAVEPAWSGLRGDLAFLSRLAVEVRYPGIRITPDDANEAARICSSFRALVRASLGIGQ